MPKLPEVHEIKRSARDPYRYDFKQASQILEALDFLRRESVKTGIPEIMEMIDASYRLLCMSYYCIRNYEMKDVAPDIRGTDRSPRVNGSGRRRTSGH